LRDRTGLSDRILKKFVRNVAEGFFIQVIGLNYRVYLGLKLLIVLLILCHKWFYGSLVCVVEFYHFSGYFLFIDIVGSFDSLYIFFQSFPFLKQLFIFFLILSPFVIQQIHIFLTFLILFHFANLFFQILIILLNKLFLMIQMFLMNLKLCLFFHIVNYLKFQQFHRIIVFVIIVDTDNFLQQNVLLMIF
jgi:hypothetical protein